MSSLQKEDPEVQHCMAILQKNEYTEFVLTHVENVYFGSDITNTNHCVSYPLSLVPSLLKGMNSFCVLTLH